MRKVRKDFYVLFIICLILLAIGSFFDYEISNYLYNRSSIFGRIINVVAQIPTYVLLTFFSMGIFTSRSKDGSLASMFSCFFGLLGACIFGFLAGYIFLLNIDLYSITMIIAADIGLIVCSYVITKLICDHDALNLNKYSKTMLISFIISIIITMAIICIFDRIPFRRLDGMVNIYYPWYQVKFLPSVSGYLHRSFPSITVLMASYILYINIFNTFARSFRKRKMITLILGYSWLFAVVLGQIISGYAYLSDAMFGIVIQALISIITFKIIYRKQVN